jgi:hypothetical protein
MAAAGERERERRRWALGRAWGVPRRVRVDAPRGWARGFYLAGGCSEIRWWWGGGAGRAGRRAGVRPPLAVPPPRRALPPASTSPRPGQRPKPPTHPHHPLSRDCLLLASTTLHEGLTGATTCFPDLFYSIRFWKNLTRFGFVASRKKNLELRLVVHYKSTHHHMRNFNTSHYLD